MQVIESPGIQFEEEDAVSFKDTPFAYRLLVYLNKKGAIINFKEDSFEGKIDASFTQLNVRKDIPEALGEVIISKFGKFITFGQIPIPSGGVEYASFMRAKNVGVRYLLMYDMRDDGLRQRWDVFVKKT